MNEQTDRPDPRVLLQFETPLDAAPKRWPAAEAQCLKFPDRYRQKCVELNEALKGLTQVERERAQLFDFVVRNLLDIVDNCEEVLKETMPVQNGRPPMEEAPSIEASSSQDAQLSARGTADRQVRPPEISPPEAPLPQCEACDSMLSARLSEEARADATDEAQESKERQPTERPAPPLPQTEPWGVTERRLGPDSQDMQVCGLAGLLRSVLYLLEEMGVRRIDLLGRTYDDVTVDGRPIEDPFEIIESTQTGRASTRRVTRVLADLWIDSDGRVLRRGKVIC
ncbi:MAG: hypothetical protein GXP27_16070 [Planctomycetes bacterium]|nr:hypothetical protein [Planctomycetota bacterium]